MDYEDQELVAYEMPATPPPSKCKSLSVSDEDKYASRKCVPHDQNRHEEEVTYEEAIAESLSRPSVPIEVIAMDLYRKKARDNGVRPRGLPAPSKKERSYMVQKRKFNHMSAATEDDSNPEDCRGQSGNGRIKKSKNGHEQQKRRVKDYDRPVVERHAHKHARRPANEYEVPHHRQHSGSTRIASLQSSRRGHDDIHTSNGHHTLHSCPPGIKAHQQPPSITRPHSEDNGQYMSHVIHANEAIIHTNAYVAHRRRLNIEKHDQHSNRRLAVAGREYHIQTRRRGFDRSEMSMESDFSCHGASSCSETGEDPTFCSDTDWCCMEKETSLLPGHSLPISYDPMDYHSNRRIYDTWRQFYHYQQNSTRIPKTNTPPPDASALSRTSLSLPDVSFEGASVSGQIAGSDLIGEMSSNDKVFGITDRMELPSINGLVCGGIQIVYNQARGYNEALMMDTENNRPLAWISGDSVEVMKHMACNAPVRVFLRWTRRERCLELSSGLFYYRMRGVAHWVVLPGAVL
ncbi:hypothetical protein BJ508DRAFT_322186 [Ascobolus immersus RN42]|uniref:Uncharacterized protein n=1 Tax=Ascobolus immersus RN42 TaxID=1160509 RepID=A0A3N4IPC4_ASCIM|nr:hypothetical protein BJ508DRAFT_322186 [Ascobolus immersus RN42]